MIPTTEIKYGCFVTLVYSNQNNLDNMYLLQHGDSLLLQAIAFEGPVAPRWAFQGRSLCLFLHIPLLKVACFLKPTTVLGGKNRYPSLSSTFGAVAAHPAS